MVIIFSYGLFFLYITWRCSISATYFHVKRNCRQLEVEIEKSLIAPSYDRDTDQITTQPIPDNYDELISNRHILSEKWRTLYFKDTKIKRMGGILIGVVSVILVIANYQNNSEKTNLLLVMLPPLVNLYNLFFEQYEVKLPVKIQKLTD